MVKNYKNGIQSIMKEFSPDPNPNIIWKPLPGASPESNTRCLHEEYLNFNDDIKISEPYIIYLLFVDILGYQYSGMSEKVAWEIPIKFKGCSFILSHRKFGFKFISNEINEKILNTANEAMTKINNAIPLVEKILQPKINEIVSEGKITIDNEYLTLRRRYKFFYERTKVSFKKKEEKYNFHKYNNPSKDNINEMLDEYFTGVEEKEYYLSATLDAFYSWLEFLLIALFPFFNSERNIDIHKIISMSWSEKFKKIFDLKNDKNIKIIYDDLLVLKEQFRNPMAHGHYLKNKGLFYIHMPNLGAIPFHLTENGKKLEYSFKRINENNFNKISGCLERFEYYIENTHHVTKLATRYLKNGLDLYFNYESRVEYKMACKSDKDMDYFIELTQKRVDDSRNMDW